MSSTFSFKPSRLATAIAGIIFSVGANSQSIEGEAPSSNNKTFATGLDSVEVVGQATNVAVTSEELESYLANSLADIFRSSPSISVGGGASGIAQKIYIRGLEDAYINITVDGAPQTSTLFHHIGRVTLDPNLLKVVEVQAGAGEATSGAGALGGAIRFKTKNINDLLDKDDSFGGKIKITKSSNDSIQNSLNFFGRLNDNWGVMAYLSKVDRDNAEDGDGNTIFGTETEQSLNFFKLDGDISENQHLSLSYEARREEGEFSARPNWVVQESAPLYASKAQRETYVANYEFKQSKELNLEVAVYQTESSFEGGRFAWLAEIATWGFDIRNTSILGKHSFTYGVDYRDDTVDSGYADSQPEEDYTEEGSALGIYAQGHSQILTPLLLSYGVRYDRYDYEQRIPLDDYYGAPITDEPIKLDSSDVNFNVGLAYDISNDVVFGLGYAEASRGKEIGDGFTIDGYLWDSNPGAMVNPNLKPEKATNIEASLEYDIDNFSAKLAVFTSEIKDVIADHNADYLLYDNIGTLETKGFELDLVYYWNDLELSFGYASADTELAPAAGLYSIDYDSVDLNGYEFNGLGNSSGDTWNIGVNYSPANEIKLGLNLKYVDELMIKTMHSDLDQAWVTELYSLKKPSYTVVDVFAEWAPVDGVTFNLAVINLFDKQYLDHSSVGDYSEVAGYGSVVGPNEAGRDIRLSTTFSF